MSTYIIISNIFLFIAYFIYEYSIFKKITVPHKTTRFLIMIILTLGTLSLYIQGDRVSIWLIGFSALHSTFIFFLSLKYGMGGWSKFDIACLIIAILGIIIWQLTNNPAIGLYAMIIADFVAYLPTFIKTYKLPNTEYWLVYIFELFATTFTLLAIQTWEIQAYIYPLYLFLAHLYMLILSAKPKLNKKFNNILE